MKLLQALPLISWTVTSAGADVPGSVQARLNHLVENANRAPAYILVVEPVAAPTPENRGSQAIPEDDQIDPEEDDPGSAVPS